MVRGSDWFVSHVRLVPGTLGSRLRPDVLPQLRRIPDLREALTQKETNTFMTAQGIVLVLTYPMCPNFNKKTHLRYIYIYILIKLLAGFTYLSEVMAMKHQISAKPNSVTAIAPIMPEPFSVPTQIHSERCYQQSIYGTRTAKIAALRFVVL